MTYEEIMGARFAASERFKEAIGQAIWFPDCQQEASALHDHARGS